MKLTEMNGKQLRQTLCELSLPLCSILQDAKVQQLMEKIMDPATPLCSVMALLLGHGVPLLLQDHLQETCRILSAPTGMSRETLMALDAPSLIRLIRSLWDEELAAFFASAGTAPQAMCSAK